MVYEAPSALGVDRGPRERSDGLCDTGHRRKTRYLIPSYLVRKGEDVFPDHSGQRANNISHEKQRHYRTYHCCLLLHISEPTRLGMISYAVFCLKKKKT